MPICGREIFYKLTKSTQKNVFEYEIRKLTAECGCTLPYKIQGVNGGGWVCIPQHFVRGHAVPLISPCCNELVLIITMSHSTECGLSFEKTATVVYSHCYK